LADFYSGVGADWLTASLLEGKAQALPATDHKPGKPGGTTRSSGLPPYVTLRESGRLELRVTFEGKLNLLASGFDRALADFYSRVAADWLTASLLKGKAQAVPETVHKPGKPSSRSSKPKSKQQRVPRLVTMPLDVVRELGDMYHTDCRTGRQVKDHVNHLKLPVPRGDPLLGVDVVGVVICADPAKSQLKVGDYVMKMDDAPWTPSMLKTLRDSGGSVVVQRVTPYGTQVVPKSKRKVGAGAQAEAPKKKKAKPSQVRAL